MDGQYWDKSGVAHDSHEAMVSADNANQASGHWAYKESASMSSVLGGGKAGFGGILYILKIIPYIISFCVYFLFSIFETSKGGKGRLLQSIAFGILVGLPVSLLFSDLFSLLPVGSKSASPQGALMLIVQISQVFSYIVIALLAIWYYKSHYGAVRCMRMNFLVLLINPLTIFIFGAVLMFVITFVMTVNGTIDGYAPNSVVIGIPFIIAAIFYLITAKPFIEQAKYLKSRNMPFPEWETKNERKQREKQEKERAEDIAKYERRKEEEKNYKEGQKEYKESIKKLDHEAEQWAEENKEQVADYVELKKQAVQFMKRKDYGSAVKLLTEMLTKCPDYTYSIKPLLAESLINNRMYDEAVKVCDEILEKNKDRLYGNDAVNAQKLRDKAIKKKG